jgi:hypothetical protein
VFAVPLSSSAAARLASIHVTGKARQAVLTDSLATTTQGGNVANVLEARRVAADRVAFRWDHRAHPMVMVRDPQTGEVLSFAGGGQVEVATSKAEVDLLLSSGVRSQLRRTRVVP